MPDAGAAVRHSSAAPASVAPELRRFDRKVGGLIVNRLTYRIIRMLGRLVRPDFDRTQVIVECDDSLLPSMTIVTPRERRGAGALLLWHGGGFVIGRPDDILPQAARFAHALGVPVICPAYRLAPEAPYPAAIDDCHAAWLRMIDACDTLAIDPQKVVVGGYSAGAGLAACLTHRLRDEDGPQPAAQLLIYPMLDDRTAARRSLDGQRHRVWSNRNNLFGWTAYIGRNPDAERLKYAAAARRNDLVGLPATWLGVGNCDLFLDEVRDYATRLLAAGVDMQYVEVDGAIHGFDMDDNVLGNAFTAAQLAFVGQHVG